jgi:hypothetical protein
MNLTIGTTRVSTWKQIKAQYVAAACGLALGASALVATSPWQHTSTRPASPVATAPTVSLFQPAGPHQFIYFLVGSQAEAAQLQATLSSEWAGYEASARDTGVDVLVVDSPQKESLIGESARELMQQGANYRFVDLRAR